ncbi:MAG: acyl-CoA thioesterase domain-containing protein, partial [Polyangiales bacterium]
MSQSTAPSPSPEPQAFVDATTWKSRGPAHFEGEIDEMWGQGRAIYGGIVGAGMVRAMRSAVPATERKRLRSISVSFAGPVDAGSVACDTRV